MVLATTGGAPRPPSSSLPPHFLSPLPALASTLSCQFSSPPPSLSIFVHPCPSLSIFVATVLNTTSSSLTPTLTSSLSSLPSSYSHYLPPCHHNQQSCNMSILLQVAKPSNKKFIPRHIRHLCDILQL